MLTVAVVGAGITGLVAARRLLQLGFRVQVFERWPDVGGMASAFEVAGGVYIDRYYHHLFESDRHMIALHEELLPGELEWHRSSVAIAANGRVWRFVSPVDLLRYGPISVTDRVRLGLVVVWLQRQRDWTWMDAVPAREWLAKTCGRRVVDQVWWPLLLGKFGPAADHVPLAWLWSKLVLRRRIGRGRTSTELLGYPRGSFRSIAKALQAEIGRHGGTILLDREVVRIERDGSRFVLHCAAPGAYRRSVLDAPAEPAFRDSADLVLSTTPTFISRKLFAWPDALAFALDEWRYRTAVVLLMESKRRLTTTYWLNIADERIPALAVIEHTNLVARDRYPAHYIYVGNYVGAGDRLSSLSTDELLTHHLPGLRRLNPDFGRDDVLRAWSFREHAAQPIPMLHNARRVLPCSTGIAGMYLANTTQIYPEDRGTNYSVRLGESAAATIARDRA